MLDVSSGHSFKILNQVSRVIVSRYSNKLFLDKGEVSLHRIKGVKQSLPAFSKICSGKQFYMFKLQV